MQESLILAAERMRFVRSNAARSADPWGTAGTHERIHAFEDLDEVAVSFAEADAARPPAGAVLQRQPGTKESRYVHLFCGLVEAFVMPDRTLRRVPFGWIMPSVWKSSRKPWLACTKK